MHRAVASLLALLLLCGQSPIANFPPGAFQNRAALDTAALTPPTINFASTTTGSGSATTTITATADFGSSFANKRVIVVMSGGFFNPAIVNGSSSIGGVAPDVSGNVQDGGGSGYGVWYASAVTSASGAGQSITLEMASATFGSAVMGVYTVDDTTLLTKTPVTGCNTVSAGTSVSATVVTLANGAIIGANVTTAGITGQSITSSTASLTLDAANIFAVAGYGHANSTGATGSSSVAWSWTGPSDGSACNLAWR